MMYDKLKCYVLCVMCYILINNKFYKKKDARISVFDHAVLLGDGIFEALRVLDGKLLDFNEHYSRLENSAKQIFLNLPINKETLKKQTEKLIKANKFINARIRITVTRGIGEGLSVDCRKQSVIIFGSELKKTDYIKGVKVVTFNIERTMPTVKSLNFLPSIIAKNYAIEQKTFEAILIDNNDCAREGATSNLFIVKNNVILTPKENILKGIVRDKVIGLAKKNKIKIRKQEITKKELLQADEVFITNSIIGIVPVVSVDSVKKGVGDISKRLIELYKSFAITKIQ